MFAKCGEYHEVLPTIVSEAKHYAAYGLSAYDGAPADLSVPTLHDIYLRPWKAYVGAGGRGPAPRGRLGLDHSTDDSTPLYSTPLHSTCTESR